MIEELLRNGSAQLNKPLTEEQINMLVKYADLLREWNKKMNLTAIDDEEGIALKHFLDSISAFATGKIHGRVLDVGTGAGFPGLVLKIAEPTIQLTLLDSLKKRITFLEAVCDELGLYDVEPIHGRAEDFAMKPEYRASYDTVVSRAVAKMESLAEWCLPYVKQDGYFIALKGPAAENEIADAKRVIAIMGGEAAVTESVGIPFTELNHKLVTVKKVRQTPMRFPRKPAIAAKYSVEQCYKMRK